MKLILLIALIAFATVAFGQQNILQYIQGTSTLSLLSGNLTNAPGLSTILGGSTNYTYIAPSNTGLSNLGTLNATGLFPNINATLYYAAASFPLNSPLPLDSNYTTLNGQLLRVNNYTAPFNALITFNGQQPTSQTAFSATNGQVFTINSVLYPPLGDAVTALSRLSQYTEFANLVARASTSAKSILTSTPSTIFIPNNAAMVSFNNTLIAGGNSIAQLNQSQIDNLVLNHMLALRVAVFSAAIPANLTNTQTQYGVNQLNITTSGGNVFVVATGNTSNTAQVVNPDIVSNGGVLHGVNAVLYPFGFVVPAPTTTGASTTGSATTGGTTGATTTGGTTSSASSVYVSYILLIVAIIAYFF